MRKLLVVLLFCQLTFGATEQKRPTADANPGGLVCGGGTEYDGWQSGDVVEVFGVVDAPGPIREANDYKISWEAAGGTYSALTLNVTSTCAGNSTGKCSVFYSTNSGSSWNTVKSASTWTSTTTTITLSSAQDLSTLKLLYCAIASDGSSGGTTGHRTLTVSDAYTEGTLGSPAASGRRKQTTQQ